MQLTASSGSTGAHVGDRTARTFFNNENDRGVAPQEAWPGDWCLMIVQQRANQRAPTLRSVDLRWTSNNSSPTLMDLKQFVQSTSLGSWTSNNSSRPQTIRPSQ
jgi:hypothetical protein